MAWRPSATLRSWFDILSLCADFHYLFVSRTQRIFAHAPRRILREGQARGSATIRLAHHLERGPGIANAYLVAATQRSRAFDLLPVDLCAIGAARIFDGPLTIVKDEARMVARDSAIEDQDIVARRAANGRDILMQQETTPRQQDVTTIGR